MQSERTDEQLAQQLAARDPAALEALYDRYGRVSFSLAVRIVGNPETAEEVVQEAFLSVWNGAATYQAGKAPLRTWLLSITHHRSIDAVRRRTARVQASPLEDRVQIVGDQDVWRDVSRGLTRDEVRGALQGLPADQRQSIELAYFSGLTYPEIAEKLGLPLGTVKSRLRLGLQKLRLAMEGAGLSPDMNI